MFMASCHYEILMHDVHYIVLIMLLYIWALCFWIYCRGGLQVAFQDVHFLPFRAIFSMFLKSSSRC